MTHTILVIDDDPVQRRLLEAALCKVGHDVIKAASGKEALTIVDEKAGSIAAIVLDLVMPEMDGMEVLDELKRREQEIPVIIQTAKGGIDTVVNAMRQGAFDFAVKPVSPDRLQTLVAKAVKYKQARKPTTNSSTNHSTKQEKNPAQSASGFIAQSKSMAPILRTIEKASASNIPVLIEGESGVGKELIAQAIHRNSTRAAKPIVVVNCGALPDNLVESILFGHDKGAFTGAVDKHVGKFEEADGGTLFLDEVGELPLNLQVKLLRAIQENVVDPVGARKSIKVDVRIVSATNKQLKEQVEKGLFREDLYYRLNVLPLTIPSLRDRQDDIQPLIYHFVKKFAREENKPQISAIQPAVLSALKAYDWPGNIRELENAVFRAIVLCDGEELTLDEFPQIASQLPEFDLQLHSDNAIGVDETANYLGTVENPPGMETPDDAEFLLPAEPEKQDNIYRSNTAVPAAGDYGMVRLISPDGQARPLAEIEEQTIQFAIEIYNGRMSEVARRLGIGRSTLYRKLKEYGIQETPEAQ